MNKMAQPVSNKKPMHPKSGVVFDVMRPGKVMASATSRPVIVGHKPQVQDGVVGGASIPVRKRLGPKSAKLSDSPRTILNHSASVHVGRLGQAAPRRTVTTAPVMAALPASAPIKRGALPSGPRRTLMPGRIKTPTTIAKNDVPTSISVVSKSESSTAPELPRRKPAPAIVIHESDGEEASAVGIPIAVGRQLPARPPSVSHQQESLSVGVRSEAVPPKAVSQSPHRTRTEPIMRMAPQDTMLEEMRGPLISDEQIDERHHAPVRRRSHKKVWAAVIILLVTIGLAVVALNLLLDLEVFTLSIDVPHTDLLNPIR